ncbi:hypothetical protein VPNG_00085 [Cytospora leucostoma]|uniref:Uncharacterized protein n=1 Tax=Cytospora leucostoma TaxID=1230097 RepID=A0A423XPC6_9PEZI|nr:hypothetical protein VPNG_00085 [Cytospora leucostoma]
MKSATAAIAAPIQISVQRSLLAAEVSVTVGVAIEEPPLTPVFCSSTLGVTVAMAILSEDPVGVVIIVVVASDPSAALATRNRIVMGLGLLVSAWVAPLAYIGMVSLGCGGRQRHIVDPVGEGLLSRPAGREGLPVAGCVLGTFRGYWYEDYAEDDQDDGLPKC